MRYQLTVYTENSVQEEALVNLGFDRNFDTEPFTLRSFNFGEVLEMVNQLVDDEFDCHWVLENKAE